MLSARIARRKMTDMLNRAARSAYCGTLSMMAVPNAMAAHHHQRGRLAEGTSPMMGAGMPICLCEIVR